MDGKPSVDDELSSRLRRGTIRSKYTRSTSSENWNSEEVHKDALAAAKAEHDRIQTAAVRAIELDELRRTHEALRREREQEAERVRIEEEKAREAFRLRELENKARQIPKPPPRLPTPPPAAPPVQGPPRTEAPKPTPPPSQPTQTAQKSPVTQTNSFAQARTTSTSTPPPNPFQKTQQQTTPPEPAAPAVRPQPQQSQPSPKASQQTHTSPSNASASSHPLPGVERYAEIHQTLKKLRGFITDGGKKVPEFKKKTGDMRRALRQSVGQLTWAGEKGANRVPVSLRPYCLSSAMLCEISLISNRSWPKLPTFSRNRSLPLEVLLATRAW